MDWAAFAACHVWMLLCVHGSKQQRAACCHTALFCTCLCSSMHCLPARDPGPPTHLRTSPAPSLLPSRLPCPGLQGYALFKHMTVAENITFGPRMRKMGVDLDRK